MKKKEPKPQQTMSVDEYLHFEERATERHEFVNGKIFAMTGGTAAHNLISTNLLSSLRSQLKGSGCKVFIADMKVRIDATNSFYYPDVLVDCGHIDKNSVFVSKPVFIFEVLSRSTASTDRREKLLAYQQIPSLEAYLIVHQSRRRVNVYRRNHGDNWTELELDDEDCVELMYHSGQAIKIPVEEIYEEIYEEAYVENPPDLHVSENVEVYIY